MKQHRLMSRLTALVLGLAVAIATLSLASAQQEPPFRYHGEGTDGDMIVAHDAEGMELGMATVANGVWYIDVDRDEADGATFTLNGEATTVELSSETSDSAKVALTVVMEEDDSMMDEGDDGEMSEDDETMMEEDGEMSEDGDSMMDEDSMEDGHMDDSMEDDHMDESMSDNGYPATGSGGLATGGVSAGLVGLLIALGAAAIAGIGVRRVRNRA